MLRKFPPKTKRYLAGIPMGNYAYLGHNYKQLLKWVNFSLSLLLSSSCRKLRAA